MPAREPGVSSMGAMTVIWPSLMPTIRPTPPNCAFGVILQFLEGIGVEKFAVGIEPADGALKRGINKLAIGDVLAVHVFAVDFLEGVVEKLQAGLRIIVLFAGRRGNKINIARRVPG